MVALQSNRIILCRNCLSDGGTEDGPVESIPVGPEKGNQYDRYRDTLDLCEDCAEALILGNLATFAKRNKTERTYRVKL